MKLREFLKAAADIEECDRILNYWGRNASFTVEGEPVSRGTKEVLVLALQQRKANLVEKLKNYGVEVEV